MASRGDRGRGRGYRGGGSSPASSDSGFRGRGRGDRGGGGPRGGGGRGGGRGGSPAGVYNPGRPANLDPRLLDNSQDELIARFKSVRINDTDFPLRPDLGTVGQVTKLRTNFFPVNIPKGPFYEYDVAISPSSSIKRVKRRIFQLAEGTNDWRASLTGSVAHDHSAKIVACKRLPQPLTIRVPFYEEDENGPPAQGGREYTLSIKFIHELETESLRRFLAGDPQYRTYDIMPIVSAFNLILGAYPNRSGGGGVMVGRNKFFMPGTGPSMSLGGGLEAVRGFYSSVRTAHHQLMVNVNACTTAFYRHGNLADALMEFLRMSHSARPTAFVKGLRVRATHLGYRKTIKRAVDHTAASYKFDSGEYGVISVEEYFLRKYRIKLKYPTLPLVDVGGQKTNYLPPEICEILPNQPFRGKLLEDHTNAMITFAARPPNFNAAAIEQQGLNELGFRQSSSPLNAFGVGVGNEMATVPGRILPAPRIKYFQDTDGPDFRADKASWNMKRVRFTKGATLEQWAILLIRDRNPEEFQGPKDPALVGVVAGFIDMCKKSGMNVKSQPPIVEVQLPNKDRSYPMRQPAIAKIREALVQGIKPKPKIILVVLSSTDRHIYSGLKRLCDVDLDVATVCVQASKVREGGLQYYANVALKFNMKLGGVNHILDKASLTWLREKPTMLVGIDVTHPGPGAVKGTPSIAAVVGSTDFDFSQYPASMRMQESKKEMVSALEAMMLERLKVFELRNKNTLPERILVYRDGVSEGQFATVIAEEMPAILAAFKTARPNYRPKLTIVICGKRHHTRFFPTDDRQADSKGNPLPGTVVDRGITSVYHYDFFLQAHGTLQGTSRPTHYYVIHDEIGFTSDKLQTLTNNVSYMFARATKAVSLVSPAYYADLACERGRCYLYEMLNGFGRSATTTAGSDEEQVRREAEGFWKNGPATNIRSTMFYL